MKLAFHFVGDHPELGGAYYGSAARRLVFPRCSANNPTDHCGSRRPVCRAASSTIAGAAARTLIRASVPERVAILLPSGVMGSAEFSDTTGLARGEPHQDR